MSNINPIEGTYQHDFFVNNLTKKWFIRKLDSTLILHIQTVKPRVSLIQVAEPSV